MNSTGAFFVRWRVRLGYPLAIAVLFFARPLPHSILYGALVGLVGLALRAWAAGYLHKQEVLTVTGPYAYTRNPLYLGSAVLALGVAIATRSWISSVLLATYFALFYSIVIRKEESELRPRHSESFDRYATAVPIFLPRLSPAKLSDRGTGTFSSIQYRKNHEWRAAVGFLLLLIVLVLIWRFRVSDSSNLPPLINKVSPAGETTNNELPCPSSDRKCRQFHATFRNRTSVSM